MARTTKTTKTATEQAYNKELRRIKQFIRRASKRGFIWLDNPIPKRPKNITEKSVERLKRRTPEYLYKKSKFVEPETGEVITYRRWLRNEKQRTEESRKADKKGSNPKKKDKAPKNKKDKDSKKNGNIPEFSDVPSDDSYDIPDEWYDNAIPPYDNDIPDDEEDWSTPQSRVVLDNVREMIDNFEPMSYWSPYFRTMKATHVRVLEYILNNAINDEGVNAVARRLEEVGSKEITQLVGQVMYDSEQQRTEDNLHRFAKILNGGPLDKWQADRIVELSEQMMWWELPE